MYITHVSGTHVIYLYFYNILYLKHHTYTTGVAQLANTKFICDKWRVEPQSLQYRWNKNKLSVQSQQELLEAEDVVAMVK